MKLKTIHTRLVLAVLAAWLLAAAPGCVRDEGTDRSAAGERYHMTLTVVSHTAASRAPHTDDDRQNGSAAENYIDFTAGDFRIVLFDKSGDHLLTLDGQQNWSLFPYPTDSDFAYYQMECEVEFPESVSQASIDRLKSEGFQVMVLANWQSLVGSRAYDDLFVPGGVRQPLTQIWRDGTHYNFAYAPGADNATWLPNHTAAAKQLIPMFGFAQATRFAERSNNGIHYATAKIPMQRAVAKIEVYDNLKEQQHLHVEHVSMTAFNTSGRFIPDVAANPNWDKPGRQVDQSSLPDGVRTNPADLHFFHEEGSGEEPGKWVAYIPEMYLGPLTMNENGEVTDDRPHLEIEIAADDLLHDVYTGGIYPAHFAKYEQNVTPTAPDPSWHHLLRNHIYRFEVNKVGLSVKLHLQVIPWQPDEEENWDFSDHVTISQELRWDEQTYESVTKQPDGENDLILLLDGTVLKGSFRIASPLNGHWYARLTPIGDAKTNAVSFVDAQGNVQTPSAGDPPACVEISGLIDGSEQHLYLLPTNLNNDYESRFKLEFWVENLGVWMNVPMPDGPYTIVRKANIIE